MPIVPYHVDFYASERGQRPIEEYLQTLTDKEIDAAMWTIGLLAAKGPTLTIPYCKKLYGYTALWELRVRHSNRHFRIVYAQMNKSGYVLLHMFQKDREAMRREDIDIAARRLKTLFH